MARDLTARLQQPGSNGDHLPEALMTLDLPCWTSMTWWSAKRIYVPIPDYVEESFHDEYREGARPLGGVADRYRLIV